MNSYLLRFDAERDKESKIVEWVKCQGDSIGCYELAGDNSHYHFWISSKKSIASIRANFKYNFPEVKGNGSYSIKSADGNVNYICKGASVDDQPIIVVNTMGISDSDIQKAHSQYWKDNEKYVTKKQKAEKTSPESNFQKALNYCKEKQITSSSDGWKIVMVLIDYYRENVKCEPNDFQLKLMAKSIQTHLVYETAKEKNKMHIYENLLKERARQVIGDTWVYPIF